ALFTAPAARADADAAAASCCGWMLAGTSARLMARSGTGTASECLRGTGSAGVAGQMHVRRQASRNHLPVDAQVPAGLGTATGTTLRSSPSGCPGVFGPVPQPVSMDGAQIARR